MQTELIKNAFTVDVEEYFHVSGFAERINPRTWGDFPSRVVGSTQRILDLLQNVQVRGTFYVLGWVAQRFPELIHRIKCDGHEIASHGFWHRLIYSQSPEEFRQDLRHARDVLEQITGERVVAYRAPSFSIVKESLWALEILAEEGFQFDSSIFPVHHDRYGLTGAERFPFGIQCASGTIWEFPPPIIRGMGLSLPVGGGGYLRLYPFPVTVSGLRQINERFGQPFAVYIHPWEFDPDQPRIEARIKSRFRHYVNLAQTERRIARLLAEFQFGSMTDSLKSLKERAEGGGGNRPGIHRFHDFHQAVMRGRHARRRIGAPPEQVAG